MARQTIGLGTAPNDGTGDPLRDAFTKVNDNFLELYQGLWRAAGSWDFSVNVSQVDFTNLGEFSEILLLGRLVTLGTSGTRNFQVGADNGSSFFSTSGDYQSVSTAGAETPGTSLAMHATASTLGRTFWARIANFNQARLKPVDLLSGTPGLITQAAAMNAVRILPSAGGSITGGSLRIFGR
ncbi:hypothetical protein ABIA22_000339 [Sinorhizobium fredii]|uniref:hypothetical protein n=1 Tax=Rhizobium fredii TaxID=380 RepID=UPI0035154745